MIARIALNAEETMDPEKSPPIAVPIELLHVSAIASREPHCGHLAIGAVEVSHDGASTITTTATDGRCMLTVALCGVPGPPLSHLIPAWLAGSMLVASHDHGFDRCIVQSHSDRGECRLTPLDSPQAFALSGRGTSESDRFPKWEQAFQMLQESSRQRHTLNVNGRFLVRLLRALLAAVPSDAGPQCVRLTIFDEAPEGLAKPVGFKGGALLIEREGRLGSKAALGRGLLLPLVDPDQAR